MTRSPLDRGALAPTAPPGSGGLSGAASFASLRRSWRLMRATTSYAGFEPLQSSPTRLAWSRKPVLRMQRSQLRNGVLGPSATTPQPILAAMAEMSSYTPRWQSLQKADPSRPVSIKLPSVAVVSVRPASSQPTA